MGQLYNSTDGQGPEQIGVELPAGAVMGRSPDAFPPGKISFFGDLEPVVQQTINAVAGAAKFPLTFGVTFASMGTGGGTLVGAFTPGFAFKIVSTSLNVAVAGTGTSATQSLNWKIGSTNVTGGVINPTLADTNAVGNNVAGSSITAANTGLLTDTLSLVYATGGTAFTAGSGSVIVILENLDTSTVANSVGAALIAYNLVAEA